MSSPTNNNSSDSDCYAGLSPFEIGVFDAKGMLALAQGLMEKLNARSVSLASSLVTAKLIAGNKNCALATSALKNSGRYTETV